MLGNLGFGELMLLLLAALLLFGAKRLPEIGASLGKGIREFKRSISDVGDAISAPPTTDAGAGRQLDAPSQSAPTTGEPKRLSQ